MDKKKRLIFFLFDMNSGGVQKSFLNFIKEIQNSFDITLFLFNKSGVFLDDVPETVKIITPSKWLSTFGSSQKETKNILKKIFRGLIAFLCKVFSSNRILPFFLKRIAFNNYDASISYIQNSSNQSIRWGCNFLALNVKAKIKMSFIHCDLQETNILDDYAIKEYMKFDYIFSVSSFSKSMMEKRGLKNVFLFYNPIDTCGVLEKSLQKIESNYYKKEKITFVTVSRLSPEKGIDRILDVCYKLQNFNLSFSWFVIGTSNLINRYIQEAQKRHIFNLYFLGEKSNPYPYIRLADYLVIPSYQECAPMVIDEAHILNTKILSTHFNSAKEFLTDEELCNNSLEGLFDAVFELLSCKRKYSNKEYAIMDNKERIANFISAINNIK